MSRSNEPNRLVAVVLRDEWGDVGGGKDVRLTGVWSGTNGEVGEYSVDCGLHGILVEASLGILPDFSG